APTGAGAPAPTVPSATHPDREEAGVMSQKAARTLKAVTAIAAATALLPAITGCAAATAGASQAPGHAADPSRSTSATRAALPIPKSVLKSLPGGTFYFTAGPN